MTFETAGQTIRSGGTMAELGEAIGVLISSPGSSIIDLLLALKHGGFVAEQAALALYKRLNRKLPADHKNLETKLHSWLEWLESDRSDCESEWDDTPEGRIAREKHAELVDLLTYALKREERLILLLYYYEEMTFEQIGLVLEMDVSRVQSIYRELLAFLRRVYLRDAKPAQRLFSDLAATKRA